MAESRVRLGFSSSHVEMWHFTVIGLPVQFKKLLKETGLYEGGGETKIKEKKEKKMNNLCRRDLSLQIEP